MTHPDRRNQVIKIGQLVESQFKSAYKINQGRYKQQMRVIQEMKRVLEPWIVVPVGSFITRASPQAYDVDIALLTTLDEKEHIRHKPEYYQ